MFTIDGAQTLAKFVSWPSTPMCRMRSIILRTESHEAKICLQTRRGDANLPVVIAGSTGTFLESIAAAVRDRVRI